MFSFFRKKALPIQAISIPDFGWNKVRNTADIIQWVNPEQSIAVSVNYFDLPPDLPTVQDVSVLRNFFRQSVSAAGGGILTVNLSQHQQIPLVSTLFKIPQGQHGITYLASVIIPFKHCSYVLKVQAAEAGPTGMREALIADDLLRSGFDMDQWSADPYDPGFREGLPMNAAESISYDASFPNHHLTQTRALIAQITEAMVLQWAMLQLPRFEQ
ncbi:hypothetical protein [Chitinophaga qingshengii]|uniref:Uncharacterized protein n=1 Tax=Chitinophaga qingshengii TaxID=1569794 RepID=A0ABR7TN93_9BACT|nr:hypothetical protein [Chitinophaga qingshengii]MBC9931018.1 hypothetical protein [Chitinophaga qingshengii]